MTTGVASPTFPVAFDVEYPERLSRLLIFFKWLLAIPHFIILYALILVAEVLTFIAWFAILFTGRYPRGMFSFVVGVFRWQYNVTAYTGLLRDEYPPFSLSPGEYAVTFDVEYPERLSRWLIFVKWLLVIPHIIVILCLGVADLVAKIISWFAILFTGHYPRGLFNFSVGVSRWGARVTAYGWLLRDEYPPFSLQ
ncbi:MAG: DUF4389 domain-containing protein [Dehalococcoidia bacterium]|jgi:hypothetical protein